MTSTISSGWLHLTPARVAVFNPGGDKDHQTGESLKMELIPASNETPFPSNPAARRYRIRVNGKASTKVKEATLTEVFNRLRGWLVVRANGFGRRNASQ